MFRVSFTIKDLFSLIKRYYETYPTKSVRISRHFASPCAPYSNLWLDVDTMIRVCQCTQTLFLVANECDTATVCNKYSLENISHYVEIRSFRPGANRLKPVTRSWACIIRTTGGDTATTLAQQWNIWFINIALCSVVAGIAQYMAI